MLHIPFYAGILGTLGKSVAYGTWLEPPKGLEDLYNLLWSFSNMPVPTVASLVIGVLGVGIFLRKRNEFLLPYRLWILLWLVPFISMFGISFCVPVFLPSYVMVAAWGYYGFLAFASSQILSYLWGKWVVAAYLLLWVFTHRYPDPDKRPFREILMPVRYQVTPDKPILMGPANVALLYGYYVIPMKFQESPTIDIQAWIDQLQAEGVYAFSRLDAKHLALPDSFWYWDNGHDFFSQQGGVGLQSCFCCGFRGQKKPPLSVASRWAPFHAFYQVDTLACKGKHGLYFLSKKKSYGWTRS
ncbi:MAG: hypothetical protein ACUVRD_07605 [Bacteroidia bacterium]